MSYLLDLALDPERMQAVREYDRRLMILDERRQTYLDAQARNDAVELGYRWPEVDKRQHPAKHQRPSQERRTGPRSASYWGGLE